MVIKSHWSFTQVAHRVFISRQESNAYSARLLRNILQGELPALNPNLLGDGGSPYNPTAKDAPFCLSDFRFRVHYFPDGL